MDNVDPRKIAAFTVMAGTICGGLLALLMFGIPVYRVWAAGMEGKALLTRAEQEKQVMIETARAERDSAELQAEAIAIVGKAAQEFPEYRHQQFMTAFGEAIQNGSVELIFVPTEGNIPLMLPVPEISD